MPKNLTDWVRDVCGAYEHQPIAIYRRAGVHEWPLVANDADDLVEALMDGGHFLPLPKEPASLANVIEVSLAEFLIESFQGVSDATAVRGTERGYPDLEVSGGAFGGGFHAIDIKVARRAPSRRQTDSRITLYTGNTYFRYPTLKWSGTFRPFQDYASHLDIIALYTLNESSVARVSDLEFVVQAPWRIASRQRSSTTREYIGAVMDIERLRTGAGEFLTEAAFYEYWRRFPFRIGRAVQNQLDRMLQRSGK